MTNPLADVEAEHGFVFGNPDGDTGAGAKPYAVLVCTDPKCAHRGQHVQIHEDTVLPLHCGGCASVLHCNHELETNTVVGGTVGNPVQHEITACTVCGTETARETTALDPAAFLSSLPAAIVNQPLQ